MTNKNPIIISVDLTKIKNTQNVTRFNHIIKAAEESIMDDEGESYINVSLAPLYDDGYGNLNYNALCTDLCASISILNAKIKGLEHELKQRDMDKTSLLDRLKAQENNMRVLRKEVKEWMEK